MTEDEMFGWHHRIDGHEFEQALGDGEGQGDLVCCSPWGCKELDTTERLNNNSFSLNFFKFVSELSPFPLLQSITFLLHKSLLTHKVIKYYSYFLNGSSFYIQFLKIVRTYFGIILWSGVKMKTQLDSFLSLLISELI